MLRIQSLSAMTLSTTVIGTKNCDTSGPTASANLALEQGPGKTNTR